MRTFLPAFLERAIPRLFSAGLMLLVARYTSPRAVGIYTYAVIAYTAAMAATDSGGRQVVLRALTEPSGKRFLRLYETCVPIFSLVVVMGTLVALKLSGIADSWRMVADLCPLAIAPTFTALNLRWAGLLMLQERWHVLARGQLVASIVSVGVAAPVLMWTRDLLGPSLQTLVAELAFFLFCARLARRSLRRAEVVDVPTPPTTIPRDMFGMVAYALVAWAQGQAQSIFMGGFAGTATLGTFNTGAALGRAPGDALGASTANVARTALAPKSTPADVRKTMQVTMDKSLALATLAPLSTITAAILLKWFLGPAWAPALQVVPILSLTAFPSVLAWSATVLQMKAGKAIHAMWAPIVGIAMSVLIAVAATHSLRLAAYTVVLREVLVVAIAYLIARAWAPWRSFWLCVAIVAVGVIACAATVGV